MQETQISGGRAAAGNPHPQEHHINKDKFLFKWYKIMPWQPCINITKTASEFNPLFLQNIKKDPTSELLNSS